MSKKYNGLNSIKIDLAQCGICETCGRRFTDPKCTHATAEQIKYTQGLDAQIEAEYEAKKTYRNRTLSIFEEPDQPIEKSIATESARIDKWLSDNWDFIPEIPFGIEE